MSNVLEPVDSIGFNYWVAEYCTAAGAAEGTAEMLLSSEEVFRVTHRVTLEELETIRARLVAAAAVPQFKSEHTNALLRELRALRAERRERRGQVQRPQCPACGGSGIAIIPIPACVKYGRAVRHQHWGRVITVAALCDRPECAAGADARSKAGTDARGRKMKSLGEYEDVAGCNLVDVMRQHEQDEAWEARGRRERPPVEVAELYPELAEILARTQKA